MAWQTNGTPDTLTVQGTLMTIPDMVAKAYNLILIHIPTGNGFVSGELFLNNNENSVYSRRQSGNGGTEFTSQNDPNWNIGSGSNVNDEFEVGYLFSLFDEEKLIILSQTGRGVAGAGNAPNRKEFVGKFVPSPLANVTRADVSNLSTGQFVAGSNLSALGTD